MARPTPLLRYAAEFMAHAAGVPVRIVGPDDHGPLDVWHGAIDARPETGLRIVDNPADVAWSAVLEDGWTPRLADGVVPFDILAATASLLTDGVNSDPPPTAVDGHDRLGYGHSYQARNGFGEIPIVDRYVRLLSSALRDHLGFDPIPRWPEGRVAAIGLSHDVDRPDKYAILRAAAHLRLPMGRRLPSYLLRAGHDLAARVRDPAPDDFWLFEPLIAAEARMGVRSTFMFAATPVYARTGTRHDVLYDVAQPRFKAAFRQIRDAGCDVGLHASYGAYRDARRFVHEKQRVEEISGMPVRGLRHHYWHLGPDEAATLRMHEAAGFEYDSSIAFNDHPGFRRSVALPYRPWDPDGERALRVTQLPVLAMDSAVMGTPREVDTLAGWLMGYVRRLKDDGGIGVLDWHVRTSYPGNARYRSWGDTYLSLVEACTAEPDLWVASLAEIADWVDERERRLLDAEADA